LTVAEQNQLLDELNDDCVFQACDGDFGWYAPSVTCNFPAQQCTVDFVVLASLGDRVTVAHFDDLVGRTASMSFLGGKSFTAYFDRAGGMIGEVTLEYPGRFSAPSRTAPRSLRRRRPSGVPEVAASSNRGASGSGTATPRILIAGTAGSRRPTGSRARSA
jgi:hypothetical protein